LTKVFPVSASDWAISFSWWGNLRSFPPVWTQLYTDPALIRSYPYLPVLERAINSAQPRPAISDYDQASLAISSSVYQALTDQKDPQQALAEMAAQLTQIISDG